MPIRSTLVALALCAAVAPLSARACDAPPAEQYVSPRELVDGAGTIVLGRAARTTPVDVTIVDTGLLVEFETVETLKGSVGPTFAVPARAIASTGPRRDFDAHRDPRFWGGLTFNSHTTDCNIYPVFREGALYLVFLDHQHIRGYEEIAAPEEDLWLAAVRRLVAYPGLEKGLALTVEEWIGLYSGAFVGAVESCSERIVSIAAILRGPIELRGRPLDEVELLVAPADCAEGARYFIVTFEDDLTVPPILYSRALRLENGDVDFGPINAEGVIEIVEPLALTLDDLRARISELP